MTTAHAIHIHHPEVEADPAKSHPMVIPGPREEVADAIESVSPEGRPADPKVGPAGMHWIVVLLGVVILLISGVVGLLFDPAAGLVMLVVGGLGFLFSPGVLASYARAHEREEVSRTMSDLTETHPDVIRVKDFPKSKPRRR